MATFTYPGVYIQELSSGVHTITGVATSIAAFVGWAPQGPTTQAVLVESWSEYETLFGGLDARSFLGYAVNQFFANGGDQAYIVRLVWDGSLTAAPGTAPAIAQTASAVWQKFGTAIISASLGGVTGSAVLAVGAALASVSVSPAAPTLAANQTVQLTAVGMLSDGTTVPLTSPVWAAAPASPNATISATGLVTAAAAGSGPATFTATEGGLTGTATVTVFTASTPTLASITISGLTVTSIPVGKSVQLAATGNYSNSTTADVTTTAAWTTSSASIVSVSATTGLITAVAAGSAIINGDYRRGVSQTLLVTVSGTLPAISLSSINLTPNNINVPIGPEQFRAVGIYTDGSQTDLTQVATWTEAGTGGTPGTGAMSGTIPGELGATGAGTMTVSAAWGGVTGNAPITIVPKALESITVSTSGQAILAGGHGQLHGHRNVFGRNHGRYHDRGDVELVVDGHRHRGANHGSRDGRFVGQHSDSVRQ